VAAHSNQKVQRQQQAGCSSVATSVADTKDLHTYLHIYLHIYLHLELRKKHVRKCDENANPLI